jgi:anti-anti-sigma factor
MQVTVSQRDGVSVMVLAGRLDAGSTAQVAEPLEALLTSGETQVLLDMGGVDYISSAGLQVLLRAAKLADAGRSRLVLCGLKAYVLEVLQMVGFASLLEMEPDCARARERF